MQFIGSGFNRCFNRSNYLLTKPAAQLRFLFSKSNNTEEKVSTDKDLNNNNNNNTNTQKNESTEQQIEISPEVLALKSKNEQLEHQLRYAVAELKNLQNRIKRQVDEAHNFGASKFIKDIFVVADTIETVLSKTPKEFDHVKTSNEESIKLSQMLKDLLVGVEMTDSMLLKTFKAHNVIKSVPLGETFDPNFHMAKYEIPKNATKYTSGEIGEVIRAGYTYNGRVLRAAEVGVVKK